MTEQYANNRVEADHGRLKAWLRRCADSNASGRPTGSYGSPSAELVAEEGDDAPTESALASGASSPPPMSFADTAITLLPSWWFMNECPASEYSFTSCTTPAASAHVPASRAAPASVRSRARTTRRPGTRRARARRRPSAPCRSSRRRAEPWPGASNSAKPPPMQNPMTPTFPVQSPAWQGRRAWPRRRRTPVRNGAAGRGRWRSGTPSSSPNRSGAIATNPCDASQSTSGACRRSCRARRGSRPHPARGRRLQGSRRTRAGRTEREQWCWAPREFAPIARACQSPMSSMSSMSSVSLAERRSSLV